MKNPDPYTPPDDRAPAHLEINVYGARARLSFQQGGEEVLWVELGKIGCRKWGEVLLEASRRLDIAL